MTRFIGTSHVASQSIRDIRKAFEEELPDFVAVELDKQRLAGLLSGQRPSSDPRLIPKIGLTGYLFALIGGFMQKKFGSMVGMQPGSEMLEAVKLAAKHNLPILLIDRPIQITLKRFSKYFSWKDRWKLFKDVLFPNKMKVKIDLRKVPQAKLVQTLLLQLKDSYPSIYNVLVHERDVFMANKIHKFKDKNLLVVVGAGHLPGIKEELKKKEFKTKLSNDY